MVAEDEGKLFSDCRICLSVDLQDNNELTSVIEENGGRIENYLTDMATHVVVGDKEDNSDLLSEAKDLYEKPVVTVRWVWLSIKAKKLLPLTCFNPENRLFSNMVVCTSGIDKADVLALWSMITCNGGKLRVKFDDECTHLLTTSCTGAKYEKALLKKITVVTPDWINECVKQHSLVAPENYSPSLLVCKTPPQAAKVSNQQLQQDVKPSEAVKNSQTMDIKSEQPATPVSQGAPCTSPAQNQKMMINSQTQQGTPVQTMQQQQQQQQKQMQQQFQYQQMQQQQQQQGQQFQASISINQNAPPQQGGQTPPINSTTIDPSMNHSNLQHQQISQNQTQQQVPQNQVQQQISQNQIQQNIPQNSVQQQISQNQVQQQISQNQIQQQVSQNQIQQQISQNQVQQQISQNQVQQQISQNQIQQQIPQNQVQQQISQNQVQGAPQQQSPMQGQTQNTSQMTSNSQSPQQGTPAMQGQLAQMLAGGSQSINRSPMQAPSSQSNIHIQQQQPQIVTGMNGQKQVMQGQRMMFNQGIQQMGNAVQQQQQQQQGSQQGSHVQQNQMANQQRMLSPNGQPGAGGPQQQWVVPPQGQMTPQQMLHLRQRHRMLMPQPGQPRMVISPGDQMRMRLPMGSGNPNGPQQAQQNMGGNMQGQMAPNQTVMMQNTSMQGQVVQMQTGGQGPMMAQQGVVPGQQTQMRPMGPPGPGKPMQRQMGPQQNMPGQSGSPQWRFQQNAQGGPMSGQMSPQGGQPMGPWQHQQGPQGDQMQHRMNPQHEAHFQQMRNSDMRRQMMSPSGGGSSPAPCPSPSTPGAPPTPPVASPSPLSSHSSTPPATPNALPMSANPSSASPGLVNLPNAAGGLGTVEAPPNQTAPPSAPMPAPLPPPPVPAPPVTSGSISASAPGSLASPTNSQMPAPATAQVITAQKPANQALSSQNISGQMSPSHGSPSTHGGGSSSGATSPHISQLSRVASPQMSPSGSPGPMGHHVHGGHSSHPHAHPHPHSHAHSHPHAPHHSPSHGGHTSSHHYDKHSSAHGLSSSHPLPHSHPHSHPPHNQHPGHHTSHPHSLAHSHSGALSPSRSMSMGGAHCPSNRGGGGSSPGPYGVSHQRSSIGSHGVGVANHAIGGPGGPPHRSSSPQPPQSMLSKMSGPMGMQGQRMMMGGPGPQGMRIPMPGGPRMMNGPPQPGMPQQRFINSMQGGPPGMMQPGPQVKVNPQTKTALANLLNNRLGGSHGGQSGVEIGPNSMGPVGAQGVGGASRYPPTPGHAHPPSHDMRTGPIGAPSGPMYRAPGQHIGPRAMSVRGDHPQGFISPPQMNQPQPPPPPEQLMGHDNPNVPADMCLIGCTFLFAFNTSKEFTAEQIKSAKGVCEEKGGCVVEEFGPNVTHVICEYQAQPFVEQAVMSGKRVVTLYWLNDVVIKGKLFPPWQALHLPMAFSTDDAPCAQHIITSTGFSGEERLRIKAMIKKIGARYSNSMTRENSLLIVKSRRLGELSEKYKRAQDWNISCVNAMWLHDVLLGHCEALRMPFGVKYQMTDSELPPLRIEMALAQTMMSPWRNPIKLTEEMMSKFQGSDIYKLVEKRKQILLERETAKKKKMEEENDENSYTALANTNCTSYSGEKPYIIFSGISDTEPLKKMVLQLGGVLAKSYKEATHLVLPKFSRTIKVMCAVNTVKHICTPEWIHESSKANTFLDASDYWLQDSDAEKQFGFNLGYIYLQRQQEAPPPLQGYTFYVTPGCLPPINILKEIVESAGGSMYMNKRPTLKHINSFSQSGNTTTPTTPGGVPNMQNEGKFVCVTCEEDLYMCKELLENNVKLYNVEVILTSILRQKVELDEYQLDIRP